MAKAPKPATAPKPPVPSDSHADIEDWIRRVMPDLNRIVKRLDELICETIPGIQYAVKWKKAYYGLPQLGWIIEMVAYDVSVNVVFFGGAEFAPPPPLGTAGRTRYVKVRTLEDAQAPEMHKWIHEAKTRPDRNILCNVERLMPKSTQRQVEQDCVDSPNGSIAGRAIVGDGLIARETKFSRCPRAATRSAVRPPSA
jgi:hypothetical protein